MSERAEEALNAALEAAGPIKVRDIEAAQQRIAGIARHLLSMGMIVLSDDEEMVA
jgi:flagellar motor switch protein FliG